MKNMKKKVTYSKKKNKRKNSKKKRIIKKKVSKKTNKFSKKSIPVTNKSIFDLKPKLVKIKKTITRKRISTGIPGLNSLIQGGFKQGSINLIEGGPGSGKTIFATQFLYEGLKSKENVAYITFEVMKNKYYENMKMFGWDLEKYERKGNFVFLAYTPEQIKKILLEGGGTIDTLVRQKKIKRIVIDSITSFALLYPSELAKKEAALTLFNVINSWDCTALLTAQEEGARDEERIVSAALDFEVDGIIILYYTKKRNVRERGVEILKMRGTKTPNKVFKMDIASKGIKVKKSAYQRS